MWSNRGVREQQCFHLYKFYKYAMTEFLRTRADGIIGTMTAASFMN